MNALLEHSVHVSAVLLLALVAQRLLGRGSAALRHWILAVAVACAWTTPALSRVVPPWLTASSYLGSDAIADLNAERGERVPNTAVAATVTTEFLIGGSQPRTQKAPFAGRAILLVWLGGLAVGLLTLLAGITRLRWLASRARRVAEGPWRRSADRLQAAAGFRRPVLLFQSDHASLLVTWGWTRPRILLPAGAQEWPEDRIDVVVAHELAHIARGDWIVQLGTELLRAAQWFNPLVWIVSRRLRAESEHACDDAVLARGIAGTDYADHLVTLARSLHRPPWLPAPAMARPSTLEGRIQAMLNTTRNRRPVSSRMRLAAFAAILILTAAVSGLRAQAQYHTLSGVVVDSTSRILPAARVTLVNPSREATYEVKTDESGRFEFVGLVPAEYSLEASVPGFATSKEQFRIDRDVQRDIRLRVGSLEETLRVTGNGAAASAPDPVAAAERRARAKAKFEEMQAREQARCAEGGAAAATGGRILPPVKLFDARPHYPEALAAMKVGGVVTLHATIGVDGAVREVSDVTGPHPDLELAAAEAVRQWMYSATLLNCQAIEVEMKVTTRFAPEP